MWKPRKGYERVNPEHLPQKLRLSVGEFARQVGIAQDVASRFLNGQQVQTATVRRVCKHFDLSLEDLLTGRIAPNQSSVEEVPKKLIGTEWEQVKVVSEVFTTPNGLQYFVCQLLHRYTPGRLGRGKCYILANLDRTIRTQMVDRVSRHALACSKIQHRLLPIHWSSFPENSTWEHWWAVDEWVEGEILAARLKDGSPITNVAHIAHDLLDVIQTLHTNGIILRALSPETILLAKDSARITDLELAKLTETVPTVSRQWPKDSYSAPELHGKEAATVRSDFYSWARVVTKLLLGKTPNPTDLRSELSQSKKLPKDVATLLEKCSDSRPTKRPSSINDLLYVTKEWMKKEASS
jgi:serine/threonine protein kinase